MASPLLIYLAGMGTVVAALSVGFGGGWILSSSEPKKDTPRAVTARQEAPPVQPVPVPVQVKPREDAQPAAAPEPPATTGAAPRHDWVAVPPAPTTQTTSAPVLPTTAPLTPPAVPPAAVAAVDTTMLPAQAATPALRKTPDVAVDAKRAGERKTEPGRTEPKVRDADEARPERPTADRKVRQAEERKSEKSKLDVSAKRERAEVEQDDSEPETPVAPPPSPPMRDAGALRGF